MFFRSSPSCRAFLLLVLLCVGVQPLSATPKKRHRKPTPANQEAPPPAPQPPPAPVELTLAQKPAVPPQVTYEYGQLTIIAENSTLGDVLRAVRTKTGATVEVPTNATQRIVIHLGPGSARDVLAALLNGSDFNYVLLGAAGDPGAVQKIIVSTKPAGGAVTQASAPPPNGIPPQVYGGAPQTDEAESDESDSETDSGNEEAEQPEPVPVPVPTQNQPAAQPGIKTPEQLLQELQQQQQLLQQQQQQQQGQPEPQN